MRAGFVVVSLAAAGLAVALPDSRAEALTLDRLKLVEERSAEKPLPGVTASAGAGGYYVYFTFSTYSTVSHGHGGGVNGNGRKSGKDTRTVRGSATPFVQVDLR